MAQKYRILNRLDILIFLAQIWMVLAQDPAGASGEGAEAEDAAAAAERQAQIYEGLVGGLGEGSVAVLVAAGCGVCLCFLKDGTNCPNCAAFAGVLWPVFIFACIWGWPKESLKGLDKTDEETLPTDLYFFKTVTFLALTTCVATCSCCALISAKCAFLQAARMGTDEGEIVDLDDGLPPPEEDDKNDEEKMIEKKDDDKDRYPYDRDRRDP